MERGEEGAGGRTFVTLLAIDCRWIECVLSISMAVVSHTHLAKACPLRNVVQLQVKIATDTTVECMLQCSSPAS